MLKHNPHRPKCETSKWKRKGKEKTGKGEMKPYIQPENKFLARVLWEGREKKTPMHALTKP